MKSMGLERLNFKRRWMSLAALWRHHERECFGYVPRITVLDAGRWVRRGNRFSCYRGDVMMSKVDKQALRDAALNATQGKWDIDYPDDGFNSDDALIQRDSVGMLPICVVEGAHPESGFDEVFQKEQQANARYIAVTNPATMLALLDENEALEKRVTELAEEIANLKAKALYWDADNTESSYEDPTDIANDLDLNPGDHFYVQVAYLDKDREYIVNDDGSVSCTNPSNC